MVTWLKALSKTRNVFSGALNKILKKDEPADEESLEDLEAALMQADVTPRLVDDLIGQLHKSYRGLKVSRREKLAEILAAYLAHPEDFSWQSDIKSRCVLLVGVNGSGKTTTAAKLAMKASDTGLQPLLGACDTFRAAGTDQVRIWAERIGCEVVAGNQGSDPAAVAYDALSAAQARGKDILFIDTAGRMHTKGHLMDEMKKIVRSLQKVNPDAPHEIWIVLDGSNGQNAITQARTFHQAVPLTGVVVTKLDGSSKAGFLFSVKKELDIPIRFAGLGEQAEDLVPFDAEEFVYGLLGINKEVEANADE